MPVTYNDVFDSYKRLSPFVHRTPVLTSSAIDKLLDCSLFFKCENFQKVGAFKFRGALNAVLQLTKEQKQLGITTHSSGNHAQALAYSAFLHNVQTHIVMPDNSPFVKKAAVKDYGAKITFCPPTLKDRELYMENIVEQEGKTSIHPYDNPHIIAGQGTVALELLEQTSFLDYVLAPVGGGGLLAGTSVSVSKLSSKTKVIGAEPIGANDAQKSFKSGILIPQQNPNTIADGLRTSLGSLNFELISKHTFDIMCVDDSEIIAAMKLIWERMKIIIEPSSAVPLAVVMKNQALFQNKRIGLILSSGNVDLTTLPF